MKEHYEEQEATESLESPQTHPENALRSAEKEPRAERGALSAENSLKSRGEAFDNRNIEAKPGTPDELKTRGDYFNNAYEIKPNEEYESRNYKYKTDELGRIQHCEGLLRLENGKRNPDHQTSAGGEDREAYDQGGHLIATRFGGSERMDNIVAMDGHLNQVEYKRMEYEFAADLKQGKEVFVYMELDYPEGSMRPETICVESLSVDSRGKEENRLYIFDNAAQDSSVDKYVLEREDS